MLFVKCKIASHIYINLLRIQIFEILPKPVTSHLHSYIINNPLMAYEFVLRFYLKIKSSLSFLKYHTCMRKTYAKINYLKNSNI